MYAFIRGKLIRATAIDAIVEAGGVGYQLLIPANALGLLPQIGSEVLLYTSYVVREQSQTLFGFITESQKNLFESLTSISGIGPKLAVSMIGHLSIQEMRTAIRENDVRTISKVPGIGKKTAERVMIEMRDKLPVDPSDLAIPVKSDPVNQTINDAMSALIHLGYNQVTAQKAIKKSLSDKSEEPDLATLITEALSHV